MTVEEQLTALFDRFYDEARAIDPTITRRWIMTDETLPEKMPSAIYFERPSSPFLIRKDNAA